jgi:formate C-acetyltransferase
MSAQLADPGTWPIVHALRREAVGCGLVDGLSPARREASLFGYVLAHLPLGFERGETLAGDFGWRFADEPERASLTSLIDRPPQPPSEPTPMQRLGELFHCSAGYTLAHTCADYQRVTEEGLEGLLAEVRRHQAQAEGERLETLIAMEAALESVADWAGRYAALARAAASGEPDEAERERLLRMAGACERVPRHPARSFHEALQSVWLVHAAIGLSELSDASLSLGRLDQYLYPLFCADLDRGVSPEALAQSVRDLWRKLNRFGDPACAVNLGGVDASGRDLFNPLSALLVGVTRSLRLPAPILAARVHPGLPQEAFEALVDGQLLTLGQPTFYGEFACREAMTRRGVPADQAHRFALNSCMGIVIPGEEISDMWGVVANLLLPLELACHAGKPFGPSLPVALATPPSAEPETFEDLYARFACCLGDLLELLIEENRKSAEWTGRERPNPLLSALTRDCLERGRDRALGGARYHSVIVEGFAWCNVADALTAIRRLVFEEGRYGLDELVEAARRDFEGEDEVRRAILRCPKFGDADDEADGMARRVTDTFAQLVSRHSRDGRCYLPSYHTLNAHVGAGRKLGASLDGRRAGEPLGKNAGPMVGRNRAGLTALLLSVSSLDQRALSGGQALDLSLDPALIRDREGRRRLQAALLTYFERGGLQIQVNGVTAAELREALREPERHRELIVRIAGYSARFVTLSRDIQEEMIERFEHGL